MAKTSDELFWVVVVLILALAVILHVFYRYEPDTSTQPKASEQPALLKPEHVPGTAWFNEWLMLRPLNLEWKINRVVDESKPYLGSTLHRYYS